MKQKIVMLTGVGYSISQCYTIKSSVNIVNEYSKIGTLDLDYNLVSLKLNE